MRLNDTSIHRQGLLVVVCNDEEVASTFYLAPVRLAILVTNNHSIYIEVLKVFPDTSFRVEVGSRQASKLHNNCKFGRIKKVGPTGAELWPIANCWYFSRSKILHSVTYGLSGTKTACRHNPFVSGDGLECPHHCIAKMYFSKHHS